MDFIAWGIIYAMILMVLLLGLSIALNNAWNEICWRWAHYKRNRVPRRRKHKGYWM